MADNEDAVIRMLGMIQDTQAAHSTKMDERMKGMETCIVDMSECIVGSIKKPNGLVHRLDDVQREQKDIKERLTKQEDIELKRLTSSQTKILIDHTQPRPATGVPHIPYAKEGGIVAALIALAGAIIAGLMKVGGG